MFGHTEILDTLRISGQVADLVLLENGSQTGVCVCVGGGLCIMILMKLS